METTFLDSMTHSSVQLGTGRNKKTSVEAYFSPAAITPLSLAANRVNDLCQPVSAADIGKSEIIVGLCVSAYFGSKLSITHCTLQCIIAICARSIIVMRAFWRQAVFPFPPLSNWEEKKPYLNSWIFRLGSVYDRSDKISRRMSE